MWVNASNNYCKKTNEIAFHTRMTLFNFFQESENSLSHIYKYKMKHIHSAGKCEF